MPKSVRVQGQSATRYMMLLVLVVGALVIYQVNVHEATIGIVIKCGFIDELSLSTNSQSIARYNKVAYSESSELLQNPRRGFWAELQTKTSSFHAIEVGTLDWRRRNNGIVVIQRIYTMDTFTHHSLSDDFLKKVRHDMQAMRDGKFTTVLRFNYVFEKHAHAPYGDASKDRVLKHINQLSPIFHEFVDIIDSIQAGFIGAWGEWHYTTYFGQPEQRDYHRYNSTFGYSPQVIQDRKDVLEAVIDAAPNEIQIQQRYPWWNRMMFGPTPATRHDVVTHTHKGRTAFHNDCFLSNKDDTGTYKDGVDVDYPYLHEQTKYLVAGGETCEHAVSDPARHKCSTSLHDMAYFHWTFLNIAFYKPVLHDWQSDGCFNDIFRKMGYRLVLKESVLPTTIHTNTDFCFRVVLRNEGFAAPFRNWELLLILRKHSTYFAVLLDYQGLDMTTWLPGKDYVIQGSVHVPNYIDAGSYQTLLAFRDPRIPTQSDYFILTANNNVPEHTNGLNNLKHTITVSHGSGHSSTCPHLASWSPPHVSKYSRVVSQVHV